MAAAQTKAADESILVERRRGRRQRRASETSTAAAATGTHGQEQGEELGQSHNQSHAVSLAGTRRVARQTSEGSLAGLSSSQRLARRGSRTSTASGPGGGGGSLHSKLSVKERLRVRRLEKALAAAERSTTPTGGAGAVDVDGVIASPPQSPIGSTAAVSPAPAPTGEMTDSGDPRLRLHKKRRDPNAPTRFDLGGSGGGKLGGRGRTVDGPATRVVQQADFFSSEGLQAASPTLPTAESLGSASAPPADEDTASPSAGGQAAGPSMNRGGGRGGDGEGGDDMSRPESPMMTTTDHLAAVMAGAEFYSQSRTVTEAGTTIGYVPAASRRRLLAPLQLLPGRAPPEAWLAGGAGELRDMGDEGFFVGVPPPVPARRLDGLQQRLLREVRDGGGGG